MDRARLLAGMEKSADMVNCLADIAILGDMAKYPARSFTEMSLKKLEKYRTWMVDRMGELQLFRAPRASSQRSVDNAECVSSLSNKGGDTYMTY